MHIHLIWLQGADLVPERFQSNLKSWRRFAQAMGHELHVWDDPQIENLIKDYMGQNTCVDYLSIYRSYPIFVQRADMGRYFILEALGGMYIDIDTSIEPHNYEAFNRALVRTPDHKIGLPPVEAGLYFNTPPFDTKIRNWLIYAPQPHHPLFPTLFQAMVARKDRKGNQFRSYYVAYSTGSVLITDHLCDEQWHRLHIHDLISNQYASTWGGIFKYDQTDLWLIVGIVLFVILMIIIGVVLYKLITGCSMNLDTKTQTMTR